MKPILFSAPMVHAIMENRKRMTRRMISPQPHSGIRQSPLVKSGIEDGHGREIIWPCSVGDILYVKEATWMFCERRPYGKTPNGRQKWRYCPVVGSFANPGASDPIYYCADHPEKPTDIIGHANTGNEWGWRKKIGMFMPRWAARLFLEVTAVRVERLQDISEEDAKEEGVMRPNCIGLSACGGGCDSCECTAPYKEHFRVLWGSLNDDRSGCAWSDNPWVFVIEFRRVEK